MRSSLLWTLANKIFIHYSHNTVKKGDFCAKITSSENNIIRKFIKQLNSNVDIASSCRVKIHLKTYIHISSQEFRDTFILFVRFEAATTCKLLEKQFNHLIVLYVVFYEHSDDYFFFET